MEQHYPIREVAAKLSCSEDTVRRMIKGGKLPAAKLGREYRISEKALACSLKPTMQEAAR